MKKWLILTNTIWMLIVLFLSAYANIQSKQARHNADWAEELSREANMHQQLAMEEAARAREAQLAAEDAFRKARLQLKDCLDEQ